MNWIKSHWKPLAVILALLLWAAWYSRPVDIYTVAPGTKEPDMMDLNLFDLGENTKYYPIKNLTPEDPEWGPALEAVEALRFRRPPWNLLLQFIPEGAIHGRGVQDGDLHIMFSIGRPKEGSVQIQFFIDQWIYNNPLPFSFANRNLTLWTEDSKETGEALAETFRPWLEEK